MDNRVFYKMLLELKDVEVKTDRIAFSDYLRSEVM